jgi:heptose-I-phosphate ethanolaminephosphotransferase
MLIIYLLLVFLYFWYKPVFSIPKQIPNQGMIAILAIVVPLFLMIFKGFERYNFIYRGINSVFEYVAEQNKMNQFEIDKPIANIEGFKLIEQIDSATYVMVIGESTTRRRLSIYGYDRPTTPSLDSIKDELWLYNDVISSHAYTIESLRKTLVTNNLQSKDDFSIIQMMNEAGFKTFWISNQKPIGQFESLTTKVALASDVYIVKNLADHKTVTPHDEVLLPDFKKILKDKAKKKFIVLHLLGTHLAYEKRYPKEFQIFNGESPSNFDHEVAHMRSNAYDNAVVYLDYILKNVIVELERIDHSSYLLYFSDHGDEVYESIDFAGHAEENPTKSMYEVPFFLWMNKEFMQNFEKTHYPNKAYMLENLIYTMSDLNGFKFKANDSTKSIFYRSLRDSKRLLGNGKYYEELVK